MPRLDGADLSHYQSDVAPIDWPTLRAATWWVATKATQGLNSKDPSFPTHWAAIETQGFTHAGAYHWLTPNDDPALQARNFMNTVGVLRVGAFAMLDAEQSGITLAQSIAWCEAVEDVIHRPCSVYSGVFVAGGAIWRSVDMRSSKYGRRPMHLAAYTTLANALKLVKGDLWDAWQYSSNGPVPGVTGRCDMNEISSVTAYDLACGLVVRPPLPPQLEDDDVKAFGNEQARQMPYGLAPAGSAIFAVGDFKRNIGAEEYAKVYGNTSAGLLSNAALDAIPDYVAPVTGAVFPQAMSGHLNLGDETFAGTVG